MAELVRRGRANGVEVDELDAAGVREREPAVARGRRAVGALDRDLRLRGDHPAAGRARRRPRRACCTPGGRCAPRCRRRADVVVHTDGGDLLAGQVVVCAGCAPTRSPAPRASIPACASSRSAASTPTCAGRRPTPSAAWSTRCPTRRSRSSACTRPAASTARSTSGRTPCSRWPARATTGGRCRSASSPAPSPTPGSSRSPRSSGATGWARCTARCRRRRWRRRSRRCCPGRRRPTCTRRTTSCGRRRGARPGGPARRVAGRRLPVRPGRRGQRGTGPAVLHVLNAPSPAATAALPIGREIVARLEGKDVGRRVTFAWPENFRSGFACFVGRPERREVDPDERARRAEGRDHLVAPADHAARHPRDRAPRGRAARRSSTPPACTSRARCSGSGSTTSCARPGPRSTSIGFCVPADQEIGPGDQYIVSELRKVAERTPVVGVAHQDRPGEPRRGRGAADGALSARGVRRDRAGVRDDGRAGRAAGRPAARPDAPRARRSTPRASSPTSRRRR